MRPKKEILDVAKRTGALDKAAFMLSLSYVVMSAANNFMGEATDFIDDYGLNLGELKQAHNTFMKTADRYFKEFSSMFSGQCPVIDYFEDLETLQAMIRGWARADEKLKKIEDKAKHQQ